jgi:hypothetical protein
MQIIADRPTPFNDRPTGGSGRFLENAGALEALLQPETALERTLLAQPAFRHGLLWGEPRFGHPEGTVALHVREVLDNIERIPGLPAPERARLRLIALAHDTFKYAEDRSRPRDWSKHHGVLARRFMEQHTSDAAVLDVVQSHDDAYYIWLEGRHEAALPPAFGALAERMHHCWQLYYLFFKCDTQTGDKTQAPLKWFEKNAPGIEVLKVREL